MRLDNKLLKEFNKENYINIFNKLVKTKTDKLTGKINLPMGVDGNDFSNINKNIETFSVNFCKRAKSGKYLFSPFRELEIPKAPYSKFELKEAHKKGKIRTLAISTINDTIFQKMIYNAIYGFIEKRYKVIDENIFGYRKGKSVKQAIEKIQRYFNSGYIYGLDGDIRKYFDEIDHEKLKFKIQRFFNNDPLIVKYLTRFIKVKRVPVANRKPAKEYYKEKPLAVDRTIGIPQGGVLSGLLANLYLYNFDKYIVLNLSKKYDIKYIRYADDFILLCKDKSIVLKLYKLLNNYFKREKLFLHPIDSSAIDNSAPNENKTKAINLNVRNYVEFLGFRISKNYLGVKHDNITKFKKVIKHIIDNGLKEDLDVERITYKINAKLLGNWIYGNGMFVPCYNCHKPQRPQSWIGFFINITDMRQLKNLDIWIRRQIRHIWFMKHHYRLPKKHFRKPTIATCYNYYQNNLVSLFNEACTIKNRLKKNKNMKFCECEEYEPIDVSLYFVSG